MPDSIQEQLMKAIASKLLLITAANGYDNTIASVQRYRWSGVDLSTMPTILVKEGDCEPELLNSSHRLIRRRLQVFLVVCVRHDEVADPRSGGEILNSYVADIEKLVGLNANWNRLAIMTDPPSYIEMEVDAETPHLARGLRCEIVYEHVRNDPYSQ